MAGHIDRGLDRRRWLRGAAAAVLLSAVPGRGGAEAAMSDVASDTDFASGAKLDLRWSVSEAAVEIAYRLSNGGRGKVVVFDRMHWRDESGRQNPDPKYALVAIGRDGSVTVDKLAPQVPDEIDVMNPYMPYGRVVAPGAVLEGRAVLRLPLKQALPYSVGKGDLPAMTSRAVFRLGIAAFPDRWDGPPPYHKAELIGGEEAVLMRHAWAMMNQRVLVSPVTKLNVPIAQPKI